MEYLPTVGGRKRNEKVGGQKKCGREAPEKLLQLLPRYSILPPTHIGGKARAGGAQAPTMKRLRHHTMHCGPSNFDCSKSQKAQYLDHWRFDKFWAFLYVYNCFKASASPLTP